MWHVPREGCADVCWGPSARTPTRTSGGAYGARSVRGVCRNGLEDACWGQGVPIEQFPWAGCTELCSGPHANLPTEAASGTPSEHEPCEGCADFFEARIQIRQWGRMSTSIWIHMVRKPREGLADMDQAPRANLPTGAVVRAPFRARSA